MTASSRKPRSTRYSFDDGGWVIAPGGAAPSKAFAAICLQPIILHSRESGNPGPTRPPPLPLDPRLRGGGDTGWQDGIYDEWSSQRSWLSLLDLRRCGLDLRYNGFR